MVHVKIVNRETTMNPTIEVEQEEDGRWLAEVPRSRVYSASERNAQEAISRAQALSVRVLADRLEHGERSRAEWCLLGGRMSHWPSTKARRRLAALQRIGWSITSVYPRERTLSVGRRRPGGTRSEAPGEIVGAMPRRVRRRLLLRDIGRVVLVVEVDVEGAQVGMQARILDGEQVRRRTGLIVVRVPEPGGVTNAEPDFQSARG